MDRVSKSTNYESPRFRTYPQGTQGWIAVHYSATTMCPFSMRFVLIPSDCPVSVSGTFGASRSSLGLEPSSGGLMLGGGGGWLQDTTCIVGIPEVSPQPNPWSRKFHIIKPPPFGTEHTKTCTAPDRDCFMRSHTLTGKSTPLARGRPRAGAGRSSWLEICSNGGLLHALWRLGGGLRRAGGCSGGGGSLAPVSQVIWKPPTIRDIFSLPADTRRMKTTHKAWMHWPPTQRGTGPCSSC